MTDVQTKEIDTSIAPEADQPGSVAEFDLDEALRASLRGQSSALNTHLACLQRDVQVGTTKTKLHCYFLPLDGNGRVRMRPLADFLLCQIVDYAIPRRYIDDAAKQHEQTGSSAAFSRLHELARSLFTNIANSGEGGELLLFAIAEAFFGLSQIICKMTIKDSRKAHYHGADGVYAEARSDGGLNLYWGESKIYGKAGAAITDCFKSLAPFLREPESQSAQREQDILLVNEFANFTDERLVAALKEFLDKDNPASLSLRHCGFAVCVFDSGAYPSEDVEKTAEEIAGAIREQLGQWVEATDRRIIYEKLGKFDIHFICVPMPSAEEFRAYFLSLLRGQDES